ncbi:unnamed protein product [Penicillium egyptiacum]|uniref:Uncharacterized protein n=1 Tax=Penicillium egyptiacum TaxID=1303716 RepID=A0A9W4KEH3_9EURO|nr:unnamed protein product [Penicillium egyptiacum]
MPGIVNNPQIVPAEDIRKGKWSGWDGVEAHKLGTCSVVAIANEEAFLLSNISSDGFREVTAAQKLCDRYNADKSFFGDKPVNVWIVYAHVNEGKGRSIVDVMRRRIQHAPILEQKYDGESFMRPPTEAGALFRLELAGCTLLATMRRQDGAGSPVEVTDNGQILRPGL